MADPKRYTVVYLSDFALCQGFAGNSYTFRVFSDSPHYVQCKILLFMVHVVDRLVLPVEPIYLHID
jgi:hypothetical protein